MRSRDDSNSADLWWTFHLGWALFAFLRLVKSSWRLCMRTRGKRLRRGDTLNLSVSFDISLGGSPEPVFKEEKRSSGSEHHSLH